ncbi:hypothetical protein FEZ32_05215 [Acidipropionibacterium jensenii]|uniref:hypothetical protein n=1 Tax=Acidipropionibacterium jensenii TaxID=1749 RepID=UPI000BC32F42|nr:hypothetical protein [Acidipropionibacterium jensenii]QCV87846.1 hypothetical protein FEZ32_05215 [Acidipropionibacterium jensenii]
MAGKRPNTSRSRQLTTSLVFCVAVFMVMARPSAAVIIPIIIGAIVVVGVVSALTAGRRSTQRSTPPGQSSAPQLSQYQQAGYQPFTSDQSVQQPRSDRASGDRGSQTKQSILEQLVQQVASVGVDPALSQPTTVQRRGTLPGARARTSQVHAPAGASQPAPSQPAAAPAPAPGSEIDLSDARSRMQPGSDIRFDDLGLPASRRSGERRPAAGRVPASGTRGADRPAGSSAITDSLASPSLLGSSLTSSSLIGSGSSLMAHSLAPSTTRTGSDRTSR